MTTPGNPVVLLILDGWGHSEAIEHNAIYSASTPVWDRLWQQSPHTLIHTSGTEVGLPEGQMGNSEVGHMTLGAGRVVYQNYTRIDKAIADGDFFTNPAYVSAIDKAIANNKAVHILGLLSPGGVHSHEDHINALIEMAAKRGASNICVHAFLDGRDCPPKSAEASLRKTANVLSQLGKGCIASICGRYYAMDRDQRWDRTRAAYDLLTLAHSEYRAPDAISALHDAYGRGETDEFVKPTLIDDCVPISDGDAVIFMNFRPDRARQITRAFTESEFTGFDRTARPELADFVMTTEYAADINAACAFPTLDIVNSLGEYLANLGKTQLRITETEKYAHVTFFFSGGREAPFDGEERVLVPSPKVATYDLKPEMSAPEITDKLVEAIESNKYDLIVCNYANGDMVGHTGVFAAAVQAAECVDACIGRVIDSVQKSGSNCLITADHGNLEEMFDAGSGQVSTQHSTLPVPLIYFGPQRITLDSGGSLADVAPTILDLMGLQQPNEMGGRSLARQVSDEPE